MLPVPSKILKDVPADLHVGVEDSKGVVRSSTATRCSWSPRSTVPPRR